MSDLVSRLRQYGHHEAADEIERLTSENARLVEAAYREGWHEGYATGDAGGSYQAVENDWLGSDARTAIVSDRKGEG
jgi:flagellar biosynthesis/type III secretory pathway protein FliH